MGPAPWAKGETAWPMARLACLARVGALRGMVNTYLRRRGASFLRLPVATYCAARLRFRIERG